MDAVYASVFWNMLGGLLALPQQFVATHGWPGLAAMVAGGFFLAALVRKGARPRVAIPVLALVALAAWWFWPERKPAPAPPRTARHGHTAAALASRDWPVPVGLANSLKQRKDSNARRSEVRRLAPVPMPGLAPGTGCLIRVVPGLNRGLARMPVLRPGAGHASTAHRGMASVPPRKGVHSPSAPELAPPPAPDLTGAARAPSPATPLGPEVNTRSPQLNALCPVCGLLFRTRLPAQERTRCPRCDVAIGVRRARALFLFATQGR